MKKLIPACAIAVALGVSASAQDSTVKSKTKVDADDARTVVMTGCLQQAPGTAFFTLAGSKAVAGDELTLKSKVETDVDDDDVEVKTRTRAEIDNDDSRPVGTSGTAVYELAPGEGVNLAAHVGHQVEIAAVMLDPKDGDDDAEVKVETKTRTDVEDGPDGKAKTKSEIELPRGAHARLTAVSVKPLAGSCSK
jgi:hypothetical protein